MASPTEMDTIQTIGESSIEIADKLHMPSIAVFDQAIYGKFQEILLGNPIWKKKFVVRMGEFQPLVSWYFGKTMWRCWSSGHFN